MTGGQAWAVGWRRRFLAAGMLAYPIVTTASLAGRGAPVIAYVLVALFAGGYLLAAILTGRQEWRRFWVVLGVMTALFVAVLPFARAEGFFLLAVVSSMAAIRLPRYGVAIIGLTVLACVVTPPLWWGAEPGWIQAITALFTALTVVGYAEIATANSALVAAREEVARLASEAERSRIARDLHDLLGHSLTAITVKSDLARRLDGAAARREIGEVEQLARQALADVRAAVSGYREVTLAGELARGRELLRAAGITASVPTAVEVVSHQELFGWVVREGLTNVVRHARAGRCTVTVTPTMVEIVDDGVGGVAGGGSGLAGLRERVVAAGGTMSAGPDGQGWRLRVIV